MRIEEAITTDMPGERLPSNFPVIDHLAPDGTVTSIKSIDLDAATYQDAGRLSYRINDYVQKLAEFDGATVGDFDITTNKIKNRVLNVVVPKGSMTSVREAIINTAIKRAKAVGIRLQLTQF